MLPEDKDSDSDGGSLDNTVIAAGDSVAAGTASTPAAPMQGIFNRRTKMRTPRPGEGGLALWDTAGEAADVRQVSQTMPMEEQFDHVSILRPVQEEFESLRASSNAFLARHGYVWEEGDSGGPGRYRVVSANDDCIALFAHGGFGLTWIAALLGWPLMHVYTSLYLPPSSITTILMDQRSPDFACPRLLGVGTLPHMEKEGLELRTSKYEFPNAYRNVPGASSRISGVKSNFF